MKFQQFIHKLTSQINFKVEKLIKESLNSIHNQGEGERDYHLDNCGETLIAEALISLPISKFELAKTLGLEI